MPKGMKGKGAVGIALPPHAPMLVLYSFVRPLLPLPPLLSTLTACLPSFPTPPGPPSPSKPCLLPAPDPAPSVITPNS